MTLLLLRLRYTVRTCPMCLLVPHTLTQQQHTTLQVGATAHALYFGDGCAQLDQAMHTLGERVFTAKR
jgi:hypothetical protein